ncbi:MAG: hypothetical protein ACLTG8_14440 [Alistipes finegoldii]|jgi:hypothetical protein|uniref:hypothetical protein n=1 Tax=Alistipes finegoldii TaxID=214856 RepID=UPI003994E194
MAVYLPEKRMYQTFPVNDPVFPTIRQPTTEFKPHYPDKTFFRKFLAELRMQNII